MKRLSLHIGSPKTGTTAIQFFLEENSAVLKERGICYPVLPRKYAKGILANRNAHVILQAAFERVNPDNVSDEYREITVKNKTALVKRIADYDHVIMSDERIWVDGARKPDLWPAIKAVAEELGFDEIDIIVYLRRQDQFVSSLWNQYIKSEARLRSTLPNYAKARKTHRVLDYDTALSHIEDCFGREHVAVRVFDREQLAHGDARYDFCDILGIEIDDRLVFPDEGQNPSIANSNITEIKRQANHAPSYRSTDNFLSSAAKNTVLRSDRASALPLQARDKLLDRYAEGNARIARDYLGRDDGVLFKSPDDAPVEWKYDSRSFSNDIIRFFSEALSIEHTKRVDAEHRIVELEKKLSALESNSEQRYKRLEQQVAYLNENMSLTMKLLRKLRRKLTSKK